MPCAVNNRFTAEATEAQEHEAGRAGKEGRNWYERKGRSASPFPSRAGARCWAPGRPAARQATFLELTQLAARGNSSKRGHTRVMAADFGSPHVQSPAPAVTNPTPVKIEALDFVSESLKVRHARAALSVLPSLRCPLFVRMPFFPVAIANLLPHASV